MRLLLAVLFLVVAGSASGQEPPRGRSVFTRCIACHSLEVERGPMPGPSLIGVVDRAAAALTDFEYSPVLVRAGADGLVWTEDALDRFLADTEAFLPGTVMGFLRLPDAADRRALIGLLKSTR